MGIKEIKRTQLFCSGRNRKGRNSTPLRAFIDKVMKVALFANPLSLLLKHRFSLCPNRLNFHHFSAYSHLFSNGLGIFFLILFFKHLGDPSPQISGL